MVATRRGVDNKEGRRSVVVLHIRGRDAVRFTPESGHVQCKQGCPLWANSGHPASSGMSVKGGPTHLLRLVGVSFAVRDKIPLLCELPHVETQSGQDMIADLGQLDAAPLSPRREGASTRGIRGCSGAHQLSDPSHQSEEAMMKTLSAAAALLLIVATPMEARAFNTGLASVSNTYSKPVLVVDQEDRSVDPGVIEVTATNPKIKLTIPWCDSSAEVKSKALNFMENGPVNNLKILFYLCQNYRDDTVYYVPGNLILWNVNTVIDWASRVKCAPAPAANIDVIIGPNGLPTCTPK